MLSCGAVNSVMSSTQKTPRIGFGTFLPLTVFYGSALLSNSYQLMVNKASYFH